MPLEDVTVTVRIGTHTDSLPLNGPKLALAIAKAIRDYAAEDHDPVEIVECESVMVEGKEWLPSLECRTNGHVHCSWTECSCLCHIRVDGGDLPERQ